MVEIASARVLRFPRVVRVSPRAFCVLPACEAIAKRCELFPDPQYYFIIHQKVIGGRLLRLAKLVTCGAFPGANL